MGERKRERGRGREAESADQAAIIRKSLSLFAFSLIASLPPVVSSKLVPYHTTIIGRGWSVGESANSGVVG